MTDSAIDGAMEMVSSVWRLILNASTSSISPVIELKHNRAKRSKRCPGSICLTRTLFHCHHWPGAAGVAECEAGGESVLLPVGSSGQDGHACSQADGSIGGEARLPRGCGKMRQIRTGGTEEPRVPEMPAEAVTLKEKPQWSRCDLFPSFMLPTHHQPHLLTHVLRAWRTISKSGKTKGLMCLIKMPANLDRHAHFCFCMGGDLRRVVKRTIYSEINWKSIIRWHYVTVEA